MSEPVPPSHAEPPSPEQPSTQGRPHSEDAPDVQGSHAQATHAAGSRLQEAVRDQALTPLHSLLRQAADLHRSLAETAAFAAVASEPEALWQRIRAYRHATRTDVLAPLHKHLAERPPSRPIGEAFEEALAALQNEPERFLGKKKQTAEWQPDVRVAEALAFLHEAAQQHAARAVAQVEQPLTAWTHAVLEAEAALDQVAFHEPPARAFRALKEPEQPPEPPDVQPVAETGVPLQEAVHALQTALEKAAEAALAPPDLDVAALRQAFQSPSGAARRTSSNPRARKGKAALGAKLASQKKAWSRWHGEAAARLALDTHFLALRDELLGLHDALIQRIAEATLYATVEAFETMKERLAHAREAVADACAKARTANDPQKLAQALRSQHGTLKQHLRDAVRRLASPGTLSQNLMLPGEPEAERLGEMVERLPERVTVHPSSDPGADVALGGRALDVEVREGAAVVLVPTLPSRLAASAQPLRAELMRLWSEADAVQNAVLYNLSAALDEVETSFQEKTDAEAETAEQAPPTPEEAIEAARELVTGSLNRSIDGITEHVAALWAPWLAFRQTTFEAFQKDWADAYQHIRREGAVEGQMAGWRARAGRQAAHLVQRSREQAARYRVAARNLFKLSERQARRLIRKGQTAAGVLETGTDDRARTLDALADAPALLAGLPLVYRKLFSFEAAAEPVLAGDRARDLVRVREHFTRWKNGQQSSALVLVLPLGSGRTSFLNALYASAFKGADVFRLSLAERLCDPDAFAGQVAQALGIKLKGEASLDTLEAHLLEKPLPPSPRVCLVDNLEYLLLRVPGGMDGLERILIFLSRTDARVCWIITTGNFTWRFVERTSGSASGLVSVYHPTHLDAAALEMLILSRHRHTGLPLRFLEPGSATPLLRQRLRAAKTPEARQTILQSDYFDRLHKLSGQNVMLALFYWLRSADFGEDGVLHVRPAQPLSFGFLADFDLSRAFTLKALLHHNTLTLGEHNRIFRMEDEESIFILESLLNLRLIEPAEGDAQAGQDRIRAGVRYRLNPLLLHPVTEYLRAQHIVY